MHDDSHISNGADVFLVDSWLPPVRSKIRSLWEWHSPAETPLRISISGAAGTGKKALAEQLSEELDIPLIESIPRTVKSLGGDINKSAGMVDEFLIFLAQLNEQYEYAEYVSASSLVDVVAHMAYVANKSGRKKDKLALDAATNLINMLTVNQYTVTIYLPYRKKPLPDGVRSVDHRYLSEIDRLIHYYLDVFDLDYLPIEGNDKLKTSTALHYLNDFHLLDNRDLD